MENKVGGSVVVVGGSVVVVVVGAAVVVVVGAAVVVGGTDGTDGPTDAAGAIVDGATWGPGAAQALERADAGTWLDGRGALLRTGPTGTNVMDLLVALRA